jgi:hypothetical protein
VLALDELGVRGSRTLPTDDERRLAEHLDAQLEALGDEFRRTGRKTVIIVDGLDHIPREQHPVRSLLAELPPPARVPDGVIIVLGSQTDQLQDVPSAVLAQLEEPGRKLEMWPLEREDVADIVRGAALVPAPDAAELDEVFRLSAGHPLALNYIISQLQMADGAAASATLAQVAPFRTRIDDQYLEHWRQVEDDYDLVRLLALLARVRGRIRIAWVRGWADPATLHRLTRRFFHYFRRESEGHWSFFHNSFRAVLSERTRETSGLPDESTQRRYLAAVQSFVSYLREMGMLTTNPLRDIQAPPPGPPRCEFLELPDVVHLVEGSARPYQATFALAYGAGLEISAILAGTESDVECASRSLRARGTKAWNRCRSPARN